MHRLVLRVLFAVCFFCALPSISVAQIAVKGTDVCSTVLGVNMAKKVRYEDGDILRSHTRICVQLNLLDSGRHPITQPGPIKVEARTAYKSYILEHVDSFRPVPNQPGIYVGILPIDDKDELDLFSLWVTVENFDTATLPPRHFSAHEQFPKVIQAVLPRQINNWRPRFYYANVPPALNKLLSHDLLFLDLRGNAKAISDFQGKLGPNALDDTREFVFAKAVLNLFYVLNEVSQKPGNPNWLNMIKEIVAIGQERFIAKVDPQLFREVINRVDVAQNLYDCNQDREANASLHSKNFAGYYRAEFGTNASKIYHLDVTSLKSPECRGNLQITVGDFKLPNGSNETLADIDFDDDFSFLAHMSDVVQHWAFNEGTNPVLVYDYLQAKSGGASLGYDLVPVRPR